MFKRTLLAIGFCLPAIGASAQTSASQTVPGYYALAPQTNCPVPGPCFIPYGSTLPVSASILGFTPSGNVANITPSVASSSVALPSGSPSVISVTNYGANTAYVKLSVGAGSASITDIPIVAGATAGFTVGSNTFLNAITSISTTNLTLAGGTGIVTGYGGGSSGGSTSGNVGILDTTDTQIDPATTETDTNTAATAVSTALIHTDTAASASSLAAIAAAINNPIPAGSSIIGKTGIDQTTPGTTNGVQVNAALPAGTNSVGGVTLRPSATNGATAYGLQSAASTNSTSVKGSAGTLLGMNLLNTSTTVYYLRMYDASSAPTCSSATNFTRTWPVPPASAAGGTGGIAVHLPVMGVAFASGIAFCLTGGPTSTDNTNAATGVFVNLDYN